MADITVFLVKEVLISCGTVIFSELVSPSELNSGNENRKFALFTRTSHLTFVTRILPTIDIYTHIIYTFYKTFYIMTVFTPESLAFKP